MYKCQYCDKVAERGHACVEGMRRPGGMIDTLNQIDCPFCGGNISQLGDGYIAKKCGQCGIIFSHAKLNDMTAILTQRHTDEKKQRVIDAAKWEKETAQALTEIKAR